ncbi:hypothetical protein CPB84DRAFT_1753139 [Gymnopilus junonius]|uniref:Uncharacterized protein n=1 Tax=Gymnopilus junonius TaxID=109634 RepID=A0A9P5TFC9_GYMJU|nr:hypothetical protein CPB84DRAFT_1753139 [Gymnopilus junonius]
MRSSVVLTPLTQSIKVIKSKGTSNFDRYCTSRHPPKVGKPHILKMHILRDCKHIPDDIRKKIEHELGAYDSCKVPSIMPTSSFSEVIPSEGPKRQSGEQWLLKNVFIPDRCILSGRILDAHVKTVEDRVEGKVKDVFILAVFFNPYIRHEIFHPSALPERDLFEVVKHIFERVYNRKSDIHLMTAYTDYWRKRSEFAFDKTELEDVAQMCSEPCDCKFAGCERSFSIFGNIHTKRRNKLDTKTVHKTGIVKTDIMRCHIAAGLIPMRKKCKFGELDATEIPSTPGMETSPAQFIDSVITEVTGIQSDDDNEDDDLPETDLFDYPADGDKDAVARFEFYWKAGIRNLEAELAAYNAGNEEEMMVTEQDVDMVDGTAS